jgi:hypothetical protein
MIRQLVTGVVVVAVASQVHAEQMKICDLIADYRPTGTPCEINGIWERTVDFGVAYRSCRAFAIEGLDDKGRVRAKAAWNYSNSASNDARNFPKMGTAALIGARQADGTKFGDSYVFRLQGNKLVGTFRSPVDKGDHELVMFKR